MTIGGPDRKWLIRERRTADLIKICCKRLVERDRLNPITFRALCQLTWITKSAKTKQVSPEYWRTTKLPALATVFEILESHENMQSLAMALVNQTDCDIEFQLEMLISADTGFTHFYTASRNCVAEWAQANWEAVCSIVRRALCLETDEQARNLVRDISSLGPVPRGKGWPLNAFSLMAPLVACLDPRARFPVLNSADHVIHLLDALKLSSATPSERFEGMVRLIGRASSPDAFALDVWAASWPSNDELIALRSPARAPRTLRQAQGRLMPEKEEYDAISIQKALTSKRRLHHNKMTNALRAIAFESGKCLDEGEVDHARYDCLIHQYNNQDRDLLVEVKASSDRGNVRLAIGQLLDYRRYVRRRLATDLAVVLPSKPDADTMDLLAEVDIKVAWFTDIGMTRLAGTVELF